LFFEIGIPGDNNPSGAGDFAGILEENFTALFGRVNGQEGDMPGMEARIISIGGVANEDEGDGAMFLFRKGVDPAEGGG
jgi:hypothetical protein